MPRALVLLTLCGGCLVPNPDWAGSDEGAAAGTTDGGTTGGTTFGSLDASAESGMMESGGVIPPQDFCPAPDPLPLDTVVVPAGTPWTGIQAAITAAGPGMTIALEPGTYVAADAPLFLEFDGVTLTSTSRSAGDTILSGGGQFPVLVAVEGNRARISDLTLATAIRGIRLGGPKPITASSTVTRVQFRNVYTAIEAADGGAMGKFTDEAEVSCSVFTISEELRSVTGCEAFRAIENHGGRDWHVRDNTFEGYFCASSEVSLPAVQFTGTSRGALIERNWFIDVHQPIMLGGEDVEAGGAPPREYADSPCDTIYWGHIAGNIRNNMFLNQSQEYFAAPLGAAASVSLWATCETVVFHNTIAIVGDMTDGYSGIEIRDNRSDARAMNNLMTNTIREIEDAAFEDRGGNIESAPLTELVDPEHGDFHLTPGASARGAGISLDTVVDDFEGDLRRDPPDVGADEYNE